MKKWESVEHYNFAGNNCSLMYNIEGVPHVMLIDKNGTIVFKGHPSTRVNLEDDIYKLMNDQFLSGPGTTKEKTDEEKEEEGENFSNMDACKIN